MTREVRLSHAGTWAFRYLVFPLAMSVGLASGGVQLAMAPSALHAMLVGVTCAIGVLVGPWVYRCRTVTATERGLVVRHAGEDLVIPFTAIAAVREIRVTNPTVVIADLKDPAPFGSRVVFFGGSPVLVEVGSPVVRAADYLRVRAGLPVAD